MESNTSNLVCGSLLAGGSVSVLPEASSPEADVNPEQLEPQIPF